MTIGAAAKLAWTNIVSTGGAVPATCYFTCSFGGFGNGHNFTANVSITDAAGNIFSNVGSATTVSVSALIDSSGGKFTAPTSGTGAQTLTIPGTGAATSTVTFTYSTGNGSWTSDNLTAHVTAGTSRTDATATLSKM